MAAKIYESNLCVALSIFYASLNELTVSLFNKTFGGILTSQCSQIHRSSSPSALQKSVPWQIACTLGPSCSHPREMKGREWQQSSDQSPEVSLAKKRQPSFSFQVCTPEEPKMQLSCSPFCKVLWLPLTCLWITVREHLEQLCFLLLVLSSRCIPVIPIAWWPCIQQSLP